MEQISCEGQLVCICVQSTHALVIPPLLPKPALNPHRGTTKQDPAAGVLGTWRLTACDGTSSSQMWFLEEGRGSVAVEGGVKRLTQRRGGSETEEDVKFLHLNFSEPHVIGCRVWMTSERWRPLMGLLKEQGCRSKQNRLLEIIHEALHTTQCRLLNSESLFEEVCIMRSADENFPLSDAIYLSLLSSQASVVKAAG